VPVVDQINRRSSMSGHENSTAVHDGTGVVGSISGCSTTSIVAPVARAQP
jgi:hypothetical protein